MEKAAYEVRRPEKIKIQVQCGALWEASNQKATVYDVERHFKGVDQGWVEDVCNQYCPATAGTASQLANPPASTSTGVVGLNDKTAEQNPYAAQALWAKQNKFCVILPVQGESWTMKEMRILAQQANDEHQRRRSWARQPKKVRGVKLQCGALQEPYPETQGSYMGQHFDWIDDEDKFGPDFAQSKKTGAYNAPANTQYNNWAGNPWVPPAASSTTSTCGAKGVHCSDSYEPRPVDTVCAACKNDDIECCAPYLDAAARQQQFVDQACLKFCTKEHFCNVLQTYDDFIAWALQDPTDALNVIGHEGWVNGEKNEDRENVSVNKQTGADHYRDSVDRKHLPLMP